MHAVGLTDWLTWPDLHAADWLTYYKPVYRTCMRVGPWWPLDCGWQYESDLATLFYRFEVSHPEEANSEKHHVSFYQFCHSRALSYCCVAKIHYAPNDEPCIGWKTVDSWKLWWPPPLLILNDMLCSLTRPTFSIYLSSCAPGCQFFVLKFLLRGRRPSSHTRQKECKPTSTSIHLCLSMDQLHKESIRTFNHKEKTINYSPTLCYCSFLHTYISSPFLPHMRERSEHI